MKNNLSLNLSCYTLYRAEFMGIAAIMIILCHATPNLILLPSIVLKVLNIGNYGVDIFMFISGLGMFYSLQNNIGSIKDWYKKRLIRIFIPYLIATFVYCMVRMHYGSFSLLDTILSLSTIDYWLYHRGAWFVAAIVPLYLITPFMSKFIEARKNKCLTVIIIVSMLIILSKVNIFNNEICANIQFVLGRVPMFVIGYYMAPHIKNGEILKARYVIIISLISVALFFFLRIFSALTIPILFILGYLIQYLHRLTLIDKIMIFMGGISLESYLTNIYLSSIFRLFDFGDYAYGNYLHYTLVILIGIPLAYLINRTSVGFIARI